MLTLENSKKTIVPQWPKDIQTFRELIEHVTSEIYEWKCHRFFFIEIFTVLNQYYCSWWTEKQSNMNTLESIKYNLVSLNGLEQQQYTKCGMEWVNLFITIEFECQSK